MRFMEASLRTGRIRLRRRFRCRAIMPEAIGSGKARAGRGSHAVACHAAHFSAKRNGLQQTVQRHRICYNVVMAKQRKPVAKTAKVGGFVVGRAHFAKISAVEGIELTPVKEKRASEAGKQGLTAEEYRRMIVRGYRKG
jgi:hypothetical protein